MESPNAEEQDFALVSAPEWLSTEQDLAWICSVLKPNSHNWKKIAAKLGFTAREISYIEAAQSPLNADPYTYLRSVLFRWLQQDYGNARDSRYYPTPDFLQKALEISSQEIEARKIPHGQGFTQICRPMGEGSTCYCSLIKKMAKVYSE